jgi:hypothetical protein
VRGAARCGHNHGAAWVGTDDVRLESIRAAAVLPLTIAALHSHALAGESLRRNLPVSPPLAAASTLSPLRI